MGHYEHLEAGWANFSSVIVLYGYRHCVQTAEEMDWKSIRLCPQGFESTRCRFDHLRIVVDASLKTRSALRGKVFSPTRNTARCL